MTAQECEMVDVAVIGGGVAGLTAAIALSRFRRSVVVIDSGQPRNGAAGELHNFLSRDGEDPVRLLAMGRDELARFGGTVREDVAVSAERQGGRFVIGMQSGASVSARRMIVASGTRDVLPAVTGIEQRWGRDVVHCPYCHGWEVRDERIGVLATDTGTAVHQAMLFRELSDDVRVFTHTAEPFTTAQRQQLDVLGIELVEGAVSELIVDDDRIAGVRLADGSTESLQVLVVASELETRSAVLDALGAQRDPDNPTSYASDATGATSVPGVWVAGNVDDAFATLILAAAAGMKAAGQLNADLVAERARLALESPAA